MISGSSLLLIRRVLCSLLGALFSYILLLISGLLDQEIELKTKLTTTKRISVSQKLFLHRKGV